MAIIIKCEMPSCCGVCHECDYSEVENGYYCAVDGKFRTLEPPRPADCPIIGEIPDTHGRLGDLDELFKQLKDKSFCLNQFERNKALRIISDAPTVLEASI